MNQGLKEFLMNEAKRDLALAKRKGEIAIAQTKLGTVTVSALSNGEFLIQAQSESFLGDSGGAVQYLISKIYDVVEIA